MLDRLCSTRLSLTLGFVAFGLSAVPGLLCGRAALTGAGVWNWLLLLSGIIALLLADTWPAQARWLLRTVGEIVSLLTLVWAASHGWARPTLINPNWIAAWLVLTLPYAANWIAALLGAAALLVTGSRAALLGVFVALIALILWSYHRAGTLKRWFVVLIGVGVIAITLVVMAARPATVWDRLATWRAACSLWVQHPLSGHGSGASLSLLSDNHADSLLVTVLMEQGAPGLLALVYLGVVITRLCFGPQGTPARLALLAFMLTQTVDATLYLPFTALFAGANMALLVRHHEGFRKSIHSQTTESPAGH